VARSYRVPHCPTPGGLALLGDLPLPSNPLVALRPLPVRWTRQADGDAACFSPATSRVHARGRAAVRRRGAPARGTSRTVTPPCAVGQPCRLVVLHQPHGISPASTTWVERAGCASITAPTPITPGRSSGRRRFGATTIACSVARPPRDRAPQLARQERRHPVARPVAVPAGWRPARSGRRRQHHACTRWRCAARLLLCNERATHACECVAIACVSAPEALGALVRHGRARAPKAHCTFGAHTRTHWRGGRAGGSRPADQAPRPGAPHRGERDRGRQGKSNDKLLAACYDRLARRCRAMPLQGVYEQPNAIDTGDTM
jgi:hypothetical protein